MKSFVAIFNGIRIIRVSAETESEAKKEIENELSRAWRGDFLKAWKNGGEEVIEE